MDEQPVPEALLALRGQIDTIDDELVELLSRRFQVTRKVGMLKAEKRLDSVDPRREQEKLERLQALAREHQLDPDFVLSLFQDIFRQVVANHRGFLKAGEDA